MPNRIARDSARTSPTLALLSDFEERGFWRLLLAADDYGRFQADPELVLAQCFPRMLDKVTRSMCEQMLRACVAAGLIQLYEVDGCLYGQFCKADKYFTRRAKTSKYPSATQTHSTRDADAPQMLRTRIASASGVSGVEEVEERGSGLRGARGGVRGSGVEEDHTPRRLIDLLGNGQIDQEHEARKTEALKLAETAERLAKAHKETEGQTNGRGTWEDVARRTDGKLRASGVIDDTTEDDVPF